MRKTIVLAAVLLAGCRADARPGPLLSVEREAVPGGTRLLLVPAPGARIGRSLQPTLTLDDGTVVRFDTSAVTPDSAYFAAPPAAHLDRPPAATHGLLEASACRADEAVCRLVKLDI